MNTLDLLTNKITITLGVVALIGTLFTIGDSRWASATDVQELSTDVQELSANIHDSHVDRLESDISEAERRIKRIMLITEEDRTNWEKGEVLDQKASKEMFLRLLNRLKEK